MARVRLVTIAVALCGAVSAVAPAVAAAGSFSGTVTGEGGGPLQGVEVCPTPQPYTFEVSCAVTGPDGQYHLSGLPGANYTISFSAFVANLPYVSEYYNNKTRYLDAETFGLTPDQNAVINVELAKGGSIAGTVTDETTDLPIAGVRVCAEAFDGFSGRCADTGPAGDYQVNGLPSDDDYRVVYEGGNRVNYLREAYDDADPLGPGTPVAVVAPGVTPGINAKLAPGAQILGHVSEIGTGLPRENVMVCAEEPDPVGYQACDWTDAAGDYAIRSIPAGTYLVAFELEYMPFGHIAGQWWKGAATAAEATPITIKPPETRTGINGQLPERFPKPKPDPIQVSLVPTPKPPPKKCKKGFHKKKVKGKVRCVRKHKRRGGKHRHRGGQHKGFSR